MVLQLSDPRQDRVHSNKAAPGCQIACPQVIELAPGMTSAAVWREASLLRQCTHDHVVPRYGVSIKAGGGGSIAGLGATVSAHWPQWPPLGSRLQNHSLPAWAPALPDCASLRAWLACPTCLQGHMLMLAMRLMRGGPLRSALQDDVKRPLLHWRAG